MLEGIGSEAQFVITLREGCVERGSGSGALQWCGGRLQEELFHSTAPVRGNIWHIGCGQNDLITIAGGFGVIFHNPNDAILFRSFGGSEDESGGLHDAKLVDDGIDGNT